MRDYGSWRRELVEVLMSEWVDITRRDEERSEQIEVSDIELLVDVELTLTALQIVNCQWLDAVPALTNRYRLYSLADFSTIFEHENLDVIAANLSHLGAHFRNPSRWKEALVEYGDLEQQIRLFEVYPESNQFEQVGSSILPDRIQDYENALFNPSPFQHWRVNPPAVGEFSFSAYDERHRDRRHYAVNITEEMLLPLNPSIALGDIGISSRDVMSISWEELETTALWMDRQASESGLPQSNQNWSRRLSGVRYQLVQDGRLVEANHILLEDITNIVGMVSSGKSTLMNIVAVWAARKGLRITLVLESIVDVASSVTFFKTLNLNATGIIGNSNRDKHLAKLHRLRTYDFREPTNPMLHRGAEFDLLSTACALQTHVPELALPLSQKDYPCRNLVSSETGSRHVCPYWAGCSTTAAERDLLGANIIVTTVYGLLYKPVPPQLIEEYASHLELVYRTSDIVVVDEADRVQVTLDSEATLGDMLIGGEGAFISRLRRRVGEQLDREQQNQLSSAFLTRWTSQLDLLNMSATQSLHLLKKAWLRRRVGNAPFSPWTLFNSFAKSLTGYNPRTIQNEGEYEELRQAFFNFVWSPLQYEHGSDITAPLVTTAMDMVPSGTQLTSRQLRIARENRRQFLAELPQTNRHVTDEDSVFFEFAIWLSIIADTIHKLIVSWADIERTLNLSDTDPTAFRGPSKELLSLIPPAPMGNVVAFQHIYDRDEPTRGGLRFLRYQGVGRAILTQLNHLMAGDGITGPHMLLLSATSWSGSSYGYHINHPISGILRSRQQEVDAITQNTQIYFEPLYDDERQPIFVSGAGSNQARQEALGKMAHTLSRMSGVERRSSRIERILNNLPEDRQKILLVVGNYGDAQFLRDRFYEYRRDWRDSEFVEAIVSDDPRYHANGSAYTGIQRGIIQHLDAMPPKIIIAPIWAVERGHNILNEDDVAALGAIFFLARPHPQPNDLLPLMLNMNRWAMETALSNSALLQLVDEYSELYGEEASLLGNAVNAFNARSRQRWYGLTRRSFAYSTLDPSDRYAFIWQHLVIIIQLIGRLVRGGVPAQVYFCDAAFAPRTATGFSSSLSVEHEDLIADNTPIQLEQSETSLLVGFYRVLEPYFDTSCSEDLSGYPITGLERDIVEALYGPFFAAFQRTQGIDL